MKDSVVKKVDVSSNCGSRLDSVVQAAAYCAKAQYCEGFLPISQRAVWTWFPFEVVSLWAIGATAYAIWLHQKIPRARELQNVELTLSQGLAQQGGA